MEVIQDLVICRTTVRTAQSAGRLVGLVPTMGALHEGHLSLVRQSVRVCAATVATIFVNPEQFGPGEDLDRYPRTLDCDLELLEKEGVEAVFVPDRKCIYPDGFSTYIDPPEVAKSLEGICRPGHFRGVATVVAKLFHIVPATHAFFGLKDYQQLKVIQAMTRDLNLDIEFVPVRTVREPDGLALSSRNRYLTGCERDRALLLSRALQVAHDLHEQGESNPAIIESAMRSVLLAANPGALVTDGVDKIEYAVVVDAETLSPLSQIDRPAVALIAACVGKTRLIDNRLLR